MSKVVFKSYNPNDNLLLPPCLGDYLPQNHPARVVSAIIDRLDDIFTQIVLLLHDEGLVSLKVQYIDGTKIESFANKYTFVWKGSTEKNKAKLEANVRSVLEAAEKALATENAEEQQELSSEEMSKRADRRIIEVNHQANAYRAEVQHQSQGRVRACGSGT